MLETTITGSLPKPAWLAKPEVLWAPWALEGAALEEAQRDAVLVAIKEQEAAGIDIVTDGEQARQHFVHGFLANLSGIDFSKRKTIGIRADRYQAECPTVTGPLKRTRSVHQDGVAFAVQHTSRKFKFTLPGPMTIVDTIADEFYGDRVKMAFALAEALNEEALELERCGVDTIQFDEPAFNVYLDEVREWGIAALERAAQGLRCTTAVHICYGYGIKANNDWKASLGEEWRQYEKTFPHLAASKIDQVSLECMHSRVPASLMGLLKGKDVHVGVIDVASNAVETPEEVAAVLREAMKYVPVERMLASTNCGMAPMPRNVAYAKLRAIAAGAALVRKELGIE
jgi:5-methyltetrahydropteroyltriglutamate--homocysteine methyltransferase